MPNYWTFKLTAIRIFVVWPLFLQVYRFIIFSCSSINVQWPWLLIARIVECLRLERSRNLSLYRWLLVRVESVYYWIHFLLFVGSLWVHIYTIVISWVLLWSSPISRLHRVNSVSIWHYFILFFWCVVESFFVSIMVVMQELLLFYFIWIGQS